MSAFHALLLGVLEGLTEFLPVSSTGHLVLLGNLLGHEDDAAKTLEIVIQLGAILAVVIFYRAKLGALARGVLARDPGSVRLAVALAIGSFPALAVGYLFHKKIKALLMYPRPVAAALIAGGVVMTAVEVVHKRRGVKGEEGIDKVTPGRALVIGLAQCFSLWPGMSRSMSTIVGGQMAGLGTATAAEFSFLLAIPTLGAATVYDLAKHGKEIVAQEGGTLALGIGMLVSFVVALAVIAAFLRYLRRFGLVPFGVYRVALGALVLVTASRSVEPPKMASAAAPPAVAAAR